MALPRKLSSMMSSQKLWNARSIIHRHGIPRILLPSSSMQQLRRFDTYRFVQKLEAEGLKRESAEAVMNSLGEVIHECLINIEKSSVSKADFENQVYTQKMDFQGVRSEMKLLEKNEFTLMKQDIGRLGRELEKLNLQMNENLRRAQSDVRLELSLEKGRIRDEQSAQEIRIKETDSKIDTEVASLRTLLETVQWELFKTLFPLFCAAGALFFSYLRFVS